MSILDALKDEAAEIQALEKDTAPSSPGTADQPPAQAPEPDAQTQDHPEPEAEPEFTPENRGQFIRRREYEAANEARKQAEARRAEVEAKYAQDMAKLNERFQVVAQTLAQGQPRAEQPKPVEIPDVNVDPIGHFQAKTALLERQLEEAKQKFGAVEQTSQQEQQLRRVGEAVRNAEAEYAKAVPDYPQSQEYLMRQWAAEAEAAGLPAEQVIRARALEIAAHAGQTRKNPAELAYGLAKARGYSVQQQQQQAPAPARPQQGPSIETLQRGMNASRSPSSAPGQAAPGELSAEAILRLEDAEFAKRFGGRDNAAWERLFLSGGRA